MNRRMLMVLVCLIFVCGAEARQRVAGRLPFDARRVLWIGAHPDDALTLEAAAGTDTWVRTEDLAHRFGRPRMPNAVYLERR